MFLTWASMARSYASNATPWTASSSCERVNTRPGSRAIVARIENSVGVRSIGRPVDRGAQARDVEHEVADLDPVARLGGRARSAGARREPGRRARAG